MSSGYQETLDNRDMAALNILDKKSEKKQYYLQGAYKLFEFVNNGIRFFGKVRLVEKKETAEFICPCGEAFRSTLPPILSGKKKHCGCGTTYKK